MSTLIDERRPTIDEEEERQSQEQNPVQQTGQTVSGQPVPVVPYRAEETTTNPLVVLSQVSAPIWSGAPAATAQKPEPQTYEEAYGRFFQEEYNKRSRAFAYFDPGGAPGGDPAMNAASRAAQQRADAYMKDRREQQEEEFRKALGWQSQDYNGMYNADGTLAMDKLSNEQLWRIDWLYKNGGREYLKPEEEGLGWYMNDSMQAIAWRNSVFNPENTKPRLVEDPLASAGATPWGQSKYDEDWATQTQYEHLGDVRANNQPWYNQLVNGIAKMGILTGTTFLDGTIGVFVGLEEMIRRGQASAYWDNPFAQAMKDVNDWSERVLPNYYTEEEANTPFALGTMNFWADKFIKNLGFTIGAIGSAVTMNAIGGAALGGLGRALSGVGKASTVVGNMSKATGVVRTVLGAGLAAVTEGSVEAINNSSEWELKEKNTLEQRINQERNAAYQELLGKSIVFAGYTPEQLLVMEPLGGPNERAAHQAFKDKWNKLNGVYTEGLKEIEKNKAYMGNMDLALNVPILMASNVLQFAKMFRGANAPIRATVGKNGLKHTMAYLSPLWEGTEEISQRWASDLSGLYYGDRVDQFFLNSIDPNYQGEALSFASAMSQSFGTTFTDPQAWEEFFIGALTGALGMPSRTKYMGPDGESHSRWSWESGLPGAFKEARRDRIQTEKVNAYLEEKLKDDPKLRNLLSGIIRQFGFRNEAIDALTHGDMDAYTSAEMKELVSAINMYAQAGRLEELKQIINESLSTSDENLAAIVQSTTRKGENGKLEGPFAKFAQETNDGRVETVFGSDESKRELIGQIEAIRTKLNQAIADYEQAYREVQEIGGTLSDEARENIIMNMAYRIYLQREAEATGVNIQDKLSRLEDQLQRLVNDRRAKEAEAGRRKERTDDIRGRVVNEEHAEDQNEEVGAGTEEVQETVDRAEEQESAPEEEAQIAPKQAAMEEQPQPISEKPEQAIQEDQQEGADNQEHIEPAQETQQGQEGQSATAEQTAQQEQLQQERAQTQEEQSEEESDTTDEIEEWSVEATPEEEEAAVQLGKALEDPSLSLGQKMKMLSDFIARFPRGRYTVDAFARLAELTEKKAGFANLSAKDAQRYLDAVKWLQKLVRSKSAAFETGKASWVRRMWRKRQQSSLMWRLVDSKNSKKLGDVLEAIEYLQDRGSAWLFESSEGYEFIRQAKKLVALKQAIGRENTWINLSVNQPETVKKIREETRKKGRETASEEKQQEQQNELASAKSVLEMQKLFAEANKKNSAQAASALDRLAESGNQVAIAFKKKLRAYKSVMAQIAALEDASDDAKMDARGLLRELFESQEDMAAMLDVRRANISQLFMGDESEQSAGDRASAAINALQNAIAAFREQAETADDVSDKGEPAQGATAQPAQASQPSANTEAAINFEGVAEASALDVLETYLKSEKDAFKRQQAIESFRKTFPRLAKTNKRRLQELEAKNATAFVSDSDVAGEGQPGHIGEQAQKETGTATQPEEQQQSAPNTLGEKRTRRRARTPFWKILSPMSEYFVTGRGVVLPMGHILSKLKNTDKDGKLLPLKFMPEIFNWLKNELGIKTPADRDAAIALHKILREQGAFDYLNSGKIKIGDKVYLMTDDSLQKGTVFMAVKKDDGSLQIVGALPNAKKGTQMANLRNEVLKGAEQAGKSKFISSYTQEVADIDGGFVVEGEEWYNLKNLRSTLPNGRKIILGIKRNGEIFTNGALSREEIATANYGNAKEGQMFVMVKDANGRYIPIPLRVKQGVRIDPNAINKENTNNSLINADAFETQARELAVHNASFRTNGFRMWKNGKEKTQEYKSKQYSRRTRARNRITGYSYNRRNGKVTDSEGKAVDGMTAENVKSERDLFASKRPTQEETKKKLDDAKKHSDERVDKGKEYGKPTGRQTKNQTVTEETPVTETEQTADTETENRENEVTEQGGKKVKYERVSSVIGRTVGDGYVSEDERRSNEAVDENGKPVEDEGRGGPKKRRRPTSHQSAGRRISQLCINYIEARNNGMAREEFKKKYRPKVSDEKNRGFSGKAFDAMLDSLDDYYDSLIASGATVYTGISFYHTDMAGNKVIGTPDLVILHASGQVQIVMFHGKELPYVGAQKSSENALDVQESWQTRTSREQWSIEMSAYHNLIGSQLGINASMAVKIFFYTTDVIQSDDKLLQGQTGSHGFVETVSMESGVVALDYTPETPVALEYVKPVPEGKTESKQTKKEEEKGKGKKSGKLFNPKEGSSYQTTTIADLFDEFAETANLPEEIRQLARQVFAATKTIGTKFSFVTIERDAEGKVVYGKSQLSTGNIQLEYGQFAAALSMIRDSRMPQEDKAEIARVMAHALLHEAVHAPVNYAIRMAEQDPESMSREMLKAVQDLKRIYDRLKSDKSLQGEYGIDSVSEMASEAISNSDFRAKLKKINLWQKFKNAIARIINSFGKDSAKAKEMEGTVNKGENALQAIERNIGTILEHAEEVNYAKFAQAQKQIGQKADEQEGSVQKSAPQTVDDLWNEIASDETVSLGKEIAKALRSVRKIAERIDQLKEERGKVDKSTMAGRNLYDDLSRKITRQEAKLRDVIDGWAKDLEDQIMDRLLAFYNKERSDIPNPARQKSHATLGEILSTMLSEQHREIAMSPEGIRMIILSNLMDWAAKTWGADATNLVLSEDMQGRRMDWEASLKRERQVPLGSSSTKAEDIEAAVNALAQKLNLTIHLARNLGEVINANARREIEGGDDIRAWYDPGTRQITLYMPYVRSVKDAVMSVSHESVGHYGLRALFGRSFYDKLDEIYENASTEVKSQINERMRKNGWDQRTAVEEYMSELAEDYTDVENNDVWQRIKSWFRNFFGFDLNDNDLRMILWNSYRNLKGESSGSAVREGRQMLINNTRNGLVATHAINERDLRKAMQAGALTNPSVGSWYLPNRGNIGSTNYGKFVFILPSQLIQDQPTFAGDGYTPTVPRPGYFAFEKKEINALADALIKAGLPELASYYRGRLNLKARSRGISAATMQITLENTTYNVLSLLAALETHPEEMAQYISNARDEAKDYVMRYPSLQYEHLVGMFLRDIIEDELKYNPEEWIHSVGVDKYGIKRRLIDWSRPYSINAVEATIENISRLMAAETQERISRGLYPVLSSTDNIGNAIANELAKLSPVDSIVSYSETKFLRPLDFSEIPAAVIPQTTPQDIKDFLTNAGVALYEFDDEHIGDQRRRALEAAVVDHDLLFRRGRDEMSGDPDSGRVLFRRREGAPPVKTGKGYKAFVLRDGKLYPPMVANPNAEATPVGVWLDADAAPVAGYSKTGRPQVKAGGRGTQGGSGTLSFRPGWHLGKIPYASQFNRRNAANGRRELFPGKFVWAEVEYAADVDYQEEAEKNGMTENGVYRHSYAGMQRVPENGFYEYRTNPDPNTDPWIISGSMRVSRVLRPSEVDKLVAGEGRIPQQREPNAVSDTQVDELNRKLFGQEQSLESEQPLQRVVTTSGEKFTQFEEDYAAQKKRFGAVREMISVKESAAGRPLSLREIIDVISNMPPSFFPRGITPRTSVIKNLVASQFIKIGKKYSVGEIREFFDYMCDNANTRRIGHIVFDAIEGINRIAEETSRSRGGRGIMRPIDIMFDRRNYHYDKNGNKKINLGVYNGHVIRLNANSAVSFWDQEESAITIVHEMIHALTAYAISNENLLGDELKKAVKDLKVLYNTIREDEQLKEMYGAKSMGETIAELANPKWRSALDEKGILQKLISALANIIEYFRTHARIKGYSVPGLKRQKQTFEQAESTSQALEDILQRFIDNFDADLYMAYAMNTNVAEDEEEMQNLQSYYDNAAMAARDRRITTKERERQAYFAQQADDAIDRYGRTLQEVADDELGKAEAGGALFRIGAKRKEEMRSRLTKQRAKLQKQNSSSKLAVATDEQIENTISEIEKIGEENKLPNKEGNPKLEAAALHWALQGTVILPEDNGKIVHAVQLAERAKVDPLSYQNPQQIIEEYAEKSKDKPVDPDTLPHLHFEKELPGGIRIYNVEENEEARKEMYEVIRTHIGKDASPWCLLETRNGKFTDLSTKRWYEVYNKHPKRVAFSNGRVCAFFANNSDKRLWWDRLDRQHANGVPIMKGIRGDELHRTGIYITNEETGQGGDMPEIAFIGNMRHGRYREWQDKGLTGFRKEPLGLSLVMDAFVISPMEAAYVATFSKNYQGIISTSVRDLRGEVSFEDKGDHVIISGELANGRHRRIDYDTREGRLSLVESGKDTHGNIVKFRDAVFYDGKKRESVDISFYESGEKSTETHYENGEMTLLLNFRESGAKWSETHYENGEKTLSLDFRESGAKWSETHYENGKMTLSLHFYESGAKWSETHYENGEMTLLLGFYESGEKSTETHYENGEKTLSLNFRESGAKLAETHYENGKMTLSLYFYESGAKRSETHYENGEMTLSLDFYESGAKRAEIHTRMSTVGEDNIFWGGDGELKTFLTRSTLWRGQTTSVQQMLSAQGWTEERFDALTRDERKHALDCAGI